MAGDNISFAVRLWSSLLQPSGSGYHVKIGKMRLLYSYHVKLNFLGFRQSYGQCHEESQGFAVWGRPGGGCPVNGVRGGVYRYLIQCI